MRKNKLFGAEEEENEINLTPMLDVVFIMLIFFIVTASFIKEAGIDVDRPDAPSADSQDDAAILIAISANDEIWIDRRETEPNAVRGMIEDTGLFRLEYFEIADERTLTPLTMADPAVPARACIAVKASTTRLIDNMAI